MHTHKQKKERERGRCKLTHETPHATPNQQNQSMMNEKKYALLQKVICWSDKKKNS